MAKWFFEPGHTAVEFRARHMMVTWVRGFFKNVGGRLDFDPQQPTKMSFEVEIAADTISTGEPARDAHLRSADFLDVEHHPTISFKSKGVKQVGAHDFIVDGDLTIRGVTREVPLDVTFHGEWETPWWEGGVDKGPKVRAGFTAQGRINRYDFNVSWNDKLPGNGVVVSPEIDLVIDAEAVRQD